MQFGYVLACWTLARKVLGLNLSHV